MKWPTKKSKKTPHVSDAHHIHWHHIYMYILYIYIYIQYLSSSLFFGTCSPPSPIFLFWGGSDVEWVFSHPSLSGWNFHDHRCQWRLPLQAFDEGAQRRIRSIRVCVFGDENPSKNDQLRFSPPQTWMENDGEWNDYGEIHWNLPLLWFLFRDSLAWSYQCDRLREVKIRGSITKKTDTLPGTNICSTKTLLKMIFLFLR